MPVLVIAVDRLPISLPGCYGNEWIDTPHLDWIAAEGMTLDQCLADEQINPQKITAAFERLRDALPASELTLLRLPGLPQDLTPPAQFADFYLEEFFSPIELHDSLCNLGIELSTISTDIEDLAAEYSWFAEALPLLANSGLYEIDRPADSELSGLLRLAAAATHVALLDTAIGEHVRQWMEQLPDDATQPLVCVVGLCGAILTRHPLVAVGMPPLVDELLRVPCLIWDGQPDHRGTRRGELLSVTEIPQLISKQLSETRNPELEITRSEIKHTLESLPTSDDRIVKNEDSVSIRTASHRFVLAGDTHQVESKVWIFIKPDDVFDRRDESRQLPDLADKVRQTLRDTFER